MINFPMPYNADAPLRDFPEEALFRVEFPSHSLLLQDPAITAISSTILRSDQLGSAKSLVFSQLSIRVFGLCAYLKAD